LVCVKSQNVTIKKEQREYLAATFIPYY